MSNLNVKTGKIQISNDIIALIAAKAALKVDGVESLVDYAGFRHKRGDHLSSHAVNLEIIRQNVSCDIRIITDYESSLLDIARRVQLAVKEDIEVMTGLNVSSVNVEIVNIIA